MKMSVISNEEHLDVEFGIVKEITKDTVVFVIGKEEIAIQANTQTLEQIKLVVEENTIPFIPVDLAAKQIVLDAEVPESKLLAGELQEIE